MPTIRIPTPLRPYTHGQAEVPVAGNTVSAALGDLTRQHPNLRQHLYTDDGELRAFVNVFLNNEDIRHLHGSDTHLAENDRLMIVPSIAGGTSGVEQVFRPFVMLNGVKHPGVQHLGLGRGDSSLRSE